MADSMDLLIRAIEARSAVSGVYGGVIRVFSPHLVGFKNGRAQVLTYQTEPTKAVGEPWRCFQVEGLSELALTDGEWVTGGGHSRPSSCVDVVVAEVSLA